MPTFLKQFLESITPQQADELWLYLDGCSNEGMIEILQPIAMRDPVIRKQYTVQRVRGER